MVTFSSKTTDILIVWAEILNNQIIGPIFYQECFNVDQRQEDQLYFHRDEAPVYYYLELKQILNIVFPGLCI